MNIEDMKRRYPKMKSKPDGEIVMLAKKQGIVLDEDTATLNEPMPVHTSPVFTDLPSMSGAMPFSKWFSDRLRHIADNDAAIARSFLEIENIKRQNATAHSLHQAHFKVEQLILVNKAALIKLAHDQGLTVEQYSAHMDKLGAQMIELDKLRETTELARTDYDKRATIDTRTKKELSEIERTDYEARTDVDVDKHRETTDIDVGAYERRTKVDIDKIKETHALQLELENKRLLNEIALVEAKALAEIRVKTAAADAEAKHEVDNAKRTVDFIDHEQNAPSRTLITTAELLKQLHAEREAIIVNEKGLSRKLRKQHLRIVDVVIRKHEEILDPSGPRVVPTANGKESKGHSAPVTAIG